MMSCRSSRPTAELRRAERQTDTVWRTEYVQVHDTTTNTVHDTVRETTTVYIDADGDTTRKDTEREHITDRSRERRNERVGERAQGESHEKETAENKKEIVVEQPKDGPIKPFLWGSAMCIGIIGIIRVIRIMKK